jgi:hypothetical protein
MRNLLSAARNRVLEPSTWAGFAAYQGTASFADIMRQSVEVDTSHMVNMLAATGNPWLLMLGVGASMVLRERAK